MRAQDRHLYGSLGLLQDLKRTLFGGLLLRPFQNEVLLQMTMQLTTFCKLGS